MKKLLGISIVAALVAVPMVNAHAIITVFDMIGDNDGFGFGVADGASVPTTVYDNRSAAEAAASNGAEDTDLAAARPLNAVFYHHSFNLSLFSVVTSATYVIDVQGVQSQFGQSRLYFDGVEVAGAFAGVDQGPFGSGLFTFAVPLAALADGMFDVGFDSGVTPIGGDIVGIDFSRLRVDGEPIPEPATLLLLGGGLLGAAVVRRRRKNA